MLAVTLLVLVIASITSILRHRDRYAASTVKLTLFTAVAWLTLAIIYTFTSMGSLDRVNLLVFIYALPVIALWLTENQTWRWVVKQWVTTGKRLLATAAYIVTLGVVVSNFWGWYFTPLSTAKRALITITEQLVTAGYHQGYASMWQANVLTELANGAIEVWCWGQPDWPNGYAATYDTLDHVWPWLQAVEHTDHYPTGKVFMIFTPEEITRYTIPQKLVAANIPVFYADANYTVYTFVNLDELRGILGETSTAPGARK